MLESVLQNIYPGQLAPPSPFTVNHRWITCNTSYDGNAGYPAVILYLLGNGDKEEKNWIRLYAGQMHQLGSLQRWKTWLETWKHPGNCGLPTAPLAVEAVQCSRTRTPQSPVAGAGPGGVPLGSCQRGSLPRFSPASRLIWDAALSALLGDPESLLTSA